MKLILSISIIILSILTVKGQTKEDYFRYRVKKNDKSLWDICSRFETSVDSVQTLNKLDNFIIKEGDFLIIPNEGKFKVHLVTSKDKNLTSVGEKYNAPYSRIKSLNKKESDTIYLGEVLVVPKVPNFINALIADCNFHETFTIDNYKIDIINQVSSKEEILTIIIDGDIKVQDTSSHNIFSSIRSEYFDFNDDGFTDIELNFSDLRFFSKIYLFDSENVTFKKIKNISHFPSPRKLKKKKNLYYSYESTGCADGDWKSILFKIKGFEIIKLAELHVDGCEYDPPKATFFKNKNPNNKIILDSKEFPFEFEYFKSGFKTELKSKFMELIWGSYLNDFE